MHLGAMAVCKSVYAIGSQLSQEQTQTNGSNNLFGFPWVCYVSDKGNKSKAEPRRVINRLGLASVLKR